MVADCCHRAARGQWGALMRKNNYERSFSRREKSEAEEEEEVEAGAATAKSPLMPRSSGPDDTLCGYISVRSLHPRREA